jgi:hypothetical protein
LTWKNKLNSLVGPTLTPGRDVPVAGVAIRSSYEFAVFRILGSAFT